RHPQANTMKTRSSPRRVFSSVPRDGACIGNTPAHTAPSIVNWRVRPEGTRLCLDDFAAAQARCADSNPLARASSFRVDRAQIHVPAPLCHVMRVADVVSKLRFLTAHCTHLSHYLLQER